MPLQRRSLLTITGGALFALCSLALLAAPVSAAYPPGGYPGPGPAGGFPTVEVSQTVGSSGGTLTATDGSVALRLTVPAGAFSQSTQVTIYKGSNTVLSSLLPSGERLLLAYAVGWTPASTAAAPLTLTITYTAIPSDATVYLTTATGATAVSGTTINAGSVTVSFTADPGVLVAEPAAASVPVTGAAAGAIGGISPIMGLLVLIVGSLLLASGVAVRRRRKVIPWR